MASDRNVIDGLDDSFAAAVLAWFGDEPTSESAAEPEPEPVAAAEPEPQREPEPALQPEAPPHAPADLDLEGEGAGGDEGYTSEAYRDGAGSRWILVLVVLALIAMVGAALGIDAGHHENSALRTDGSSTTSPPSTIKAAARATTSTSGNTSTTDTSSVTTTTVVPGDVVLVTVPPDTSTTVPPPTTTTIPPTVAHLVVTGAPLAFGKTSNAQYIDLANTGGTPMMWSGKATMFGTSVVPSSGVIAPHSHGAITVKFDRPSAPEGSLTGQLTLSGNGGTVVLPMSADVERPPFIWTATASPATLYTKPACGAVESTVTTVVTDPAGVSVVLVYDNGLGDSGRVPMAAGAGSSFTGVLGPFRHQPGPVSWSIEATDGRGNVSHSKTFTLQVLICQ